MSAVVESVVANNLSGASGVFTKPSGLSVGDVMYAIVIGDGNAGPIPSIPSGWTSLHTVGTGFLYSRVAYKVADSSDVSASDFTFTNGLGGVLYRTSGTAPTLASIGVGTVYPAGTLVIIVGQSGDNDGTQTTFTGYSVTGGASPTFTERLDNCNTTGIIECAGIADAIYNSPTAISAFNVTLGGGLDESTSYLIMIPATANASGTTALLTTSPEIVNPAYSVSAPATTALLTTTPSFQTPTSEIEASKWTNTDKNSATNITNTDKS